MSETVISKPQYLRIATLPLAVYREIAAHLEQVQGVSVELIWDSNPSFDYLRSQTSCLKLQLRNPERDSEPDAEEWVQRILRHYSDRFGQWEALDHEA